MNGMSLPELGHTGRDLLEIFVGLAQALLLVHLAMGSLVIIETFLVESEGHRITQAGLAHGFPLVVIQDHIEGTSNFLGNVLLNGDHVSRSAVVVFRPEMEPV